MISSVYSHLFTFPIQILTEFTGLFVQYNCVPKAKLFFSYLGFKGNTELLLLFPNSIFNAYIFFSVAFVKIVTTIS